VTEPTRCNWAPWGKLMLRYHDEEWGVPSHDERHLFEMLTLEGAQAGFISPFVLSLSKHHPQRAHPDSIGAPAR